MTDKPTVIEPERFYSLQEVQNLKLIPHIASRQTLQKKIEYELTLDTERRILNATFEGEDQSRRYFIKGQNIINYLAKLDEGGPIY